MEKLKQALEKLSKAINELEDSVDFCIKNQNKQKDKIETLQAAIQTSYQRIEDALIKLETSPEEQEDDICLSLP